MTFILARIVASGAMAVLTAVLGASISVAADRIQASGAPQTGPIPGDRGTEVVLFSDVPGCQPHCVGLASWESTVADDDLVYGLALVYTAIPEFRAVAREAAARGTTVTWGELPSTTGGQYTASDRAIVINHDLRAEPLSVLAAVLGHEVAHAADDRSGHDGADCFDAETHAFKWGAALFDALVNSLPLWETGWVRSFRQDVINWTEGQMQERVVLSSHYQEQCLGRTLDS